MKQAKAIYLHRGTGKKMEEESKPARHLKLKCILYVNVMCPFQVKNVLKI